MVFRRTEVETAHVTGIDLCSRLHQLIVSHSEIRELRVGRMPVIELKLWVQTIDKMVSLTRTVQFIACEGNVKSPGLRVSMIPPDENCSYFVASSRWRKHTPG